MLFLYENTKIFSKIIDHIILYIRYNIKVKKYTNN